MRKDLWNYDPSARWKKQHRKPIVYPPAIHRSSRPLRRQHFEPGEWRIGRAQAGTTFYDIVRSWKAGYLFLVTPEGWPSGLRQRMYVRYTGNRIGGSNPSPLRHSRFQHIAFGYETFDDLLGTYARLKGLGILPGWAADHGVGTALYYEDPDRNIVELNVNNYNNEWAATEHMRNSPSFAWVNFDPEK